MGILEKAMQDLATATTDNSRFLLAIYSVLQQEQGEKSPSTINALTQTYVAGTAFDVPKFFGFSFKTYIVVTGNSASNPVLWSAEKIGVEDNVPTAGRFFIHPITSNSLSVDGNAKLYGVAYATNSNPITVSFLQVGYKTGMVEEVISHDRSFLVG